MQARVLAPESTLAEIRQAATAELPGATLRRRLLFRYTLIWHKPRSQPDILRSRFPLTKRP